ncbi:MAG: reductive dehalogenase [Deltaproteobacteria bacterium]|nr:reductive dehalogenase [Deltaproteobacteria bacterium]
MKHHSTVSNREHMKQLGLTGGNPDSPSTPFHDLDEVISSPKALWHRPWWVRWVDEPTVEVDWERKERFDATKIQQVSWRKYVGVEKAKELNRRREEKMKQWMLENRPGYTLRARALDIAGSQGGSVGVTFLGSWARTSEETKDEGKLFTKDVVRSKLLDPARARRHRKLIYAIDALDGKHIIFENVDRAYEDEKKRVIPEKARWAIVFSIQMSEELLKRRAGLAPSAFSSSASGAAYGQARNIMDRTQNFLHILGYHGLMGTWFNGLGIAPALGVMAGLGELSRLNRMLSPEYGPFQRVFKIVTDLPLAPTKPIDAGIMRFCRTCKVCAEKCPADVLSMETEPFWETVGPWNNPGHKTWYENSTACRTWWAISTAGCSTCFSVCPFGKKDKSLIHKIVKMTIAKNPIMTGFVNNIITKMDGVFGYQDQKDIEAWWGLNMPPHGVDNSRGTALE